MQAFLTNTTEANTIVWEKIDTIDLETEEFDHSSSPFEFLEKKMLRKNYFLGKVFKKINSEKVQEEKCNFPEVPSPEEICEHFMCGEKLKLWKFGKHIDVWLVHHATGGLIRANKNRDFFKFTGPRKNILFFKTIV